MPTPKVQPDVDTKIITALAKSYTEMNKSAREEFNKMAINFLKGEDHHWTPELFWLYKREVAELVASTARSDPEKEGEWTNVKAAATYMQIAMVGNYIMMQDAAQQADLEAMQAANLPFELLAEKYISHMIEVDHQEMGFYLHYSPDTLRENIVDFCKECHAIDAGQER